MQCSGCGEDIPVAGSVCPYCGRDKSDDRASEWIKILFAIIGAAVGYSIYENFWGTAGCFFGGYIVGAIFGMLPRGGGKKTPRTERVSSPVRPQAAPHVTSAPAQDSAETKLVQLKRLHDQGLLTAEEYASKKAEILARF